MPATIDDYSWWKTWRPRWAEAHCVTLVDHLTPQQVVATVGGRQQLPAHGADEFIARAEADFDPNNATVGVTAVGDWTVMIEMNGWLGVTETAARTLSAGRTVVSHFRNVNAVHQFVWWQDGVLLTDFDLLFPTERLGAEPDGLAGTIVDVGVPLDGTDTAGIDLSAAGFALAERITGVRCTPELFQRNDFLVAAVPMPVG